MSPHHPKDCAGRRNAGATRPAAALPRLRAVAAALVLSTGLTGCLGYTHVGDEYVPETHSERFPYTVTRAMARLDVGVDSGRLTDDDRMRVAQFAQDYRTGSGGPMIVARPSGGHDHVAAAATVASIQKELRGAGLASDAIAYRVYQAGGAEAAPVILTYERYEAVLPECGHWPTNLANTYANRPYPNLGCASRRNLAAMVANPRDLVEPRAMTPADQERRGVIIDAWRKGETTQSQRSKDDSGQVSEQKQSGG